MTVYVDDMRAAFGRMVMCHMVADSDAELLAMAESIGVRRKWRQGDHFDICLQKRALAVAAGATEVTQRQLGAMAARRRTTGSLGQPADAIEWFRSRIAELRTGTEETVRPARVLEHPAGHLPQIEPAFGQGTVLRTQRAEAYHATGIHLGNRPMR